MPSLPGSRRGTPHVSSDDSVALNMYCFSIRHIILKNCGNVPIRRTREASH